MKETTFEKDISAICQLFKEQWNKMPADEKMAIYWARDTKLITEDQFRDYHYFLYQYIPE